MKLPGIMGVIMAGVMTAGALYGCSGEPDTTAAAGGETKAQTESGQKTVINVWSKDRRPSPFHEKGGFTGSS